MPDPNKSTFILRRKTLMKNQDKTGPIRAGITENDELQSYLRELTITQLRGKSPYAKAARESHAMQVDAGIQKQDYDTWLNIQAKDKQWGTDVEVRALGELYGISIACTPVNNGVAQNTTLLYESLTKDAPVIHLYNLDDKHWYFHGNQPRATKGGGNCLYHTFAQGLNALKADDLEISAEERQALTQSFDRQLAAFEKEVSKLKSDPIPHEKAHAMIAELKSYKIEFEEGTIKRDAFATKCLISMNKDKRRKELEAYPGMGRVLKNLALAILGVGIGYAIAIGINKYQTGRWFFLQTPAAEQLDALEKTLRPRAK